MLTAPSIDVGEVLIGSLPQAKIKIVQAWIEINKEDLIADWKLAVAGEPVFKIDLVNIRRERYMDKIISAISQ